MFRARHFILFHFTLDVIYNPTAEDTIWLAGRNAPTLGEDFRVRVAFGRLKSKSGWRVQKIRYDRVKQMCEGYWDDGFYSA
ncbi:MAG: SfiI family type II restriction endonuclease [bacterium]|nr:SfiI family type II restriction endonuclease [bacterium]